MGRNSLTIGHVFSPGPHLRSPRDPQLVSAFSILLEDVACASVTPCAQA
jgi:hypothetical protein